MPDQLNPRQRKFAELYDGNIKDTAIKAGYAPGSAEVTGSRLLRNAKVRALIDSREQQESRINIASRQQRQEFWSDVMQNIEVDMKDRLKASELLGKSECDFTEKVQHSGSIETVVVIQEGLDGEA